MAAAGAVLGVTRVELRDYPDGHLEEVARHLLGPNLFQVDVGRARWRGRSGGKRMINRRNCHDLSRKRDTSASEVMLLCSRLIATLRPSLVSSAR